MGHGNVGRWAIAALAMASCGVNQAELTPPQDNAAGSAATAPDAGSATTAAAPDSGSSAPTTDPSTDPATADAASTAVVYVDQVQLEAAVARAASGGQAVGGLALHLTDAPVALDEVWVTFCGVRVHGVPEASDTGAGAGSWPADAGMLDPAELDADAGVSEGETAAADDGNPAEAPRWFDVSKDCQSVDLLTLRDGATMPLSMASLPVGSYDEIRLMLTESWVISEGVRSELSVPSGSQSGLKVLTALDIVPGAIEGVVLDFDAAASIHETGAGDYKMIPVIKVASHEHHSAASRDSAPDASSANGAPDDHGAQAPDAADKAQQDGNNESEPASAPADKPADRAGQGASSHAAADGGQGSASGSSAAAMNPGAAHH